ncbi:MarR family transcriptional regulator [Brevibacillus nitrificans]|uniref:MarR family transcriptional regulator n=1 Tax=Brevibacillus nitrificans TaxID=651560 RepID=A0A3M8DJH2_9BACL|nr:MarR family transcriptional regulator [Brevibacillus nitrificans]MED1791696.1 MarR family transcriptional regulator [Brevibacillus nitrificans]RNB88272.1 MarR family transcriptional regulator [Brevibacillus nitrificans]
MDLKQKIWDQWVLMLHKQEDRAKRREALLLEQIRKSMPDYDEVADLSITELHVIQSIGEKGNVNVTSLAQRIGVTKSAISKITSKLLKKGLIDRYQLEDNQKEVFFRLTSGGESVFSFHEIFHRRLERQMLSFLSQYSDSELEFLQRVMRDATVEMEKSWKNQ